MLDFMKSEDDAINILKKDHEKVKGLFEEFEKTDDRRRKKSIAAEAIQELKIHATIEEEIFYPAVRGHEEVEEDLMNEADEEHHVAKLLIAELDQMSGSEDHFDAKFKVLAENIRHHIKEEEGKMMPEARKAEIHFEALGQELMNRKKELKKEGIPPSAEEKMISRFGMKDDSPAQNKRKQAAKNDNRKSVRGSYSSGSRSSVKRSETKPARKAKRGH